ncbi:MAG: non-hydrolyzing UDP-N-acetylglucosamine 2-epimerase [Candidatus Limimorpha sp.]
MKITTVIGARPQIIKASALSRAIRDYFADDIQEVIIHTGQHYDNNMSKVFFDELEIPKPDYNLGVGSLSHGRQTARMIEGVEEILIKEKPDYLILYGDTNSTLAGAIAASKLRVPIAHIEAGLRSFNKAMPEEINRICCDHCSTLLFSPTVTGYNNLIKEGFSPGNKPRFTADNPGIFHCGDVMFDNSKYFASVAEKRSDILKTAGLSSNGFILCTIHRENNTDDKERLRAIFNSIINISEETPIVLPLHPRTSKILRDSLDSVILDKITDSDNIVTMPPVSFFDMITLERNSKMVITDSGGVQKEAFFYGKPCVILRGETEWREIVECGAAILTDADESRIQEAYKAFTTATPQYFPDIFGDGDAAKFICKEMLKNIN